MKILIIRFSSIGDIILTSPIVRCIRKKYPNAEIHFLTKSSFKNLVVNNPYIDVVHTLTKSDDKDLFQELSNVKYNLVIDLHKNLRTRRIKEFLGGVKWYSYKKLNIQKWLYVNFKINLLPNKHIVDRYFDGLKDLEVENDGKGIDFFFSTDLDFKLSDYNLTEKHYTVIAIGGTYYTKQIPNNVLEDAINRLDDAIVLIGAGESDGKKAAELVHKCNNPKVLNLCNKLSIEQSAALIQSAKSLITGDTGMMHIASAFDTPIITLWGNTSKHLGMYAYREDSKAVYNHSVPLKCNPCSKLGSDSCPRGHFKCMNMQNVEQIVKNC